MKTKLIISGLAFIAITTLASAQNNGVNHRRINGTGQGHSLVDANKNGICDNYENRTSNASSCKRYGNINYCGQGQRQGRRHEKEMLDQGQGQWQETLSMQIKMVYATIMKLLPKSRAYFPKR